MSSKTATHTNCSNCNTEYDLIGNCGICVRILCAKCLQNKYKIAKFAILGKISLCDTCYQKSQSDENTTSLTDVKTAEECQIAIAISLSKIDEQMLQYWMNDKNVDDDEDLKVVLRLSVLEENARQAAVALGTPHKYSSEEEELSLALALSKIDNEETSTSSSNENKNRQGHCPICFEEKLEYALKNCGHVFCSECIPKLLKQCPICRAEICGAIRLNLPS